LSDFQVCRRYKEDIVAYAEGHLTQ